MRERIHNVPYRLVAFAFILLACGAVAAQDFRLITFGGASLEGNYYAIAKAICRKINALKRDDLRCSPEATPGSLYNLHGMQKGELDFALVQSDWQRAAAEGTGPFSGKGPMTGLRSVISLYQEALTFAARRDTGIRSLEDLKGKILDIGHSSSGRRGTTQRLINALNFPPGYCEYRELMGAALVNGLCDGTVDATMTVFGHPNVTIAKVLRDCDLVLVPVTGPKVDAFLNENADYSSFVIAAGTYPGMTGPVKTFSVAATLVARDDIPQDIVALFVRTLLANYEELREDLPVLPAGDPLARRSDGLTAPLHPGAVAVFEESGG